MKGRTGVSLDRLPDGVLVVVGFVKPLRRCDWVSMLWYASACGVLLLVTRLSWFCALPYMFSGEGYLLNVLRRFDYWNLRVHVVTNSGRAGVSVGRLLKACWLLWALSGR